MLDRPVSASAETVPDDERITAATHVQTGRNAPAADGMGAASMEPNRLRYLPLAITAAVCAVLAIALKIDVPVLSPHIRHFVGALPKLLFSQTTVLVLLGLTLVMLLELPLLGWRNSSFYRLSHPTRSTITDIIMFLATLSGVTGLLTVLFTFGLSSVLSDGLIRLVPRSVFQVHNPILQLLLGLVVIDFAKYWWHYFVHKVPFAWESHKYHHAATEFNVITTARGHPIDNAVRLLFVTIPTALLGGNAADFMLLNLLLVMHSGLTHSMINWRFGWVGRWILVSPITHRIHHSDMPEHFDKNLGSIFIFWDRLFGTYYHGPNINTAVNVDHNYYNRRSFLNEMFDCEYRSWKSLIKSPLGFAHASGTAVVPAVSRTDTGAI